MQIGYHQESSEDMLPNSAQLILASATIPMQLENILANIVNVSSFIQKLKRIYVFRHNLFTAEFFTTRNNKKFT